MNLNFEDESKKERKRQLIKESIRWAIEIGIVIIIAFFIVFFFMSRVVMLGGSMENTLVNGQEVIVNKAAYLVLSPSRNDVIAFYQTDEAESAEDDHLITFRRVVGLPGEKVQIKEGSVYIDGEKLEEKYDFIPMESGGLAENEITLGEDEYFVLGDSRNDSEDSRFRSFGNVVEKNIVGRAIFKMDSFSMIGGPSGES